MRRTRRRRRRRNRLVRVSGLAVLAVAVATSALVLALGGRGPASSTELIAPAVIERAIAHRTVEAPIDARDDAAVPTTGGDARLGAARVVSSDPATMEIVPDPAMGDLRLDTAADTLPIGYDAAPAATELRDVAYGPDPAHRLDLFLPEAADAPVVLYLHAGGWTSGDKAEIPAMVLRFVERGYAVASVNYRLAPEHTFPAPVLDVKRAVRWLKAYGSHSATVDGDRIVAYGTSAGGHLAAFVAATPGRFEPTDLPPAEAAVDSTVAGIVSVVGPTDLTTFHRQSNEAAVWMTGQFLGCDPCGAEALAVASPITYVGDGLPPAYWAYGEIDALVLSNDQARPIAAAWADAAGTESWIDVVERIGHNIDRTAINQRRLETFVDLAASPT